MENKKFIFIGLVIFAILVLGIVNSITERKTVSECKEIIQKIENESFKGIVFQKPIVNKSTKLIIDSNIGIFRLYPCCPDLYYSSNVGDSIVKLKNTNFVKIKNSQNNNWVKYKYKFIPYSCGNLHPCDLDN